MEGSGFSMTSTSRGRVGRQQAAGLAHHHDPPVDQEGRREAGVDDGSHHELVPRATADLLDDQHMVTLAHHLGQQRPHLLGHQRGVVTLYQVGRRRAGVAGAHGASLTAARVSRTRQVPRTSCTRSTRQPHAIPRAAAPREAARRSVSSRSRIRPRKVLLDAERSSG